MEAPPEAMESEAICIRFAVEASSWSNGSLSWSLHGSIGELLMLQSSGMRSLWRSVYRISLQDSKTVKKVRGFPAPTGVCHLPNSPWPGIIKYFPARESLVGDILAGDGKTANLFLQ
jgi:hypothetical protein